MADNERLTRFLLDTIKAGEPARHFLNALRGEGDDGGMQPADCEAYFQRLLQSPKNSQTERTTLESRPPPPYRWNAEADTFAIAAHRFGQTATQISTQLCRNGYEVTAADVTASLSRQGIVHDGTSEAVPTWTAPTSGLDAFRLDSRADAFITAANDVGHTVSQILAELDAKGYTASEAGIAASLNKQGGEYMRVR